MKSNIFIRIKNSALIRGSIILLIGSFIVNVSNYLFHLIMGRMLGPADYGILASLISIFYLISVPSATLLTVAMKFTSEFFAKKKFGEITTLIWGLSRRFFWIGIIILFIFIMFSRVIADFLHIDSIYLIIIIGFSSIISFLISINRGIIQGLQKFSHLIINTSIESFLKLSLSIVLVFWGWKVYGPIAAIFIAMFFAYLISFAPIIFVFKQKRQEIDKKEIMIYSLPTLFIILFSMLLYNSDIILVKHFFSAHDAGLYSALSILGKIIFFSSGAITQVMFPLTAYLAKRNQDSSKILKQTLFINGLITLFILVLYFFFPRYLVSILFGNQYLEISPYLFYFGIIFFIFSAANIFINYFLSINKLRFVYFLGFLATLEIILITIFHQNIISIIIILTSIMILLLLGLIYYFNISKFSKSKVTNEKTLSHSSSI